MPTEAERATTLKIRTATSRALPGRRVQRELQDVTCARIYIHAMTRPNGARGFDRVVLEQLATTPIGDEVMFLPRDVRYDLLMVLRSHSPRGAINGA